jgi:hypothetical protein
VFINSWMPEYNITTEDRFTIFSRELPRQHLSKSVACCFQLVATIYRGITIGLEKIVLMHRVQPSSEYRA